MKKVIEWNTIESQAVVDPGEGKSTDRGIDGPHGWDGVLRKHQFPWHGIDRLAEPLLNSDAYAQRSAWAQPKIRQFMNLRAHRHLDCRVAAY